MFTRGFGALFQQLSPEDPLSAYFLDPFAGPEKDCGKVADPERLQRHLFHKPGITGLRTIQVPIPSSRSSPGPKAGAERTMDQGSLDSWIRCSIKALPCMNASLFSPRSGLR